MSAHDRYLARHSTEQVTVECQDCGFSWDDTLESEYGASWLTVHEECSRCGCSDNLDVCPSDYEPDWDSIRDKMMFDGMTREGVYE